MSLLGEELRILSGRWAIPRCVTVQLLTKVYRSQAHRTISRAITEIKLRRRIESYEEGGLDQSKFVDIHTVF